MRNYYPVGACIKAGSVIFIGFYSNLFKKNTSRYKKKEAKFSLEYFNGSITEGLSVILIARFSPELYSD